MPTVVPMDDILQRVTFGTGYRRDSFTFVWRLSAMIVCAITSFGKKYTLDLGVQMSKMKFWWGNDDPQDKRIFALALVFGFVMNCFVLYLFAAEVANGQPAIDSGLSLSSMRGILIVTLGWIFCFLSAMGGQISTKMKFQDNEEASHLAERGLMNTLEHAIPSLLLIWLAGIYCNAVAATVFGGVYVCARFLYPVFYGWYGQFTMLVEFSTQLGYVAIGVLSMSLVGQVLWNDSLLGHFVLEWYQPFCVFACWLAFCLIFWNAIGFTLYGIIYSRGIVWKQKFDTQQQKEEETST